MIPELRCPRCDAELAGPNRHDGPSYRCARCGGRAVTLAGLRPRHPAVTLRAVWQATSPDRELGCPACHTRMLAVKPDFGEVILALDVCRRCQLVWFDAGELEQLPALELAAPRVVPSWPTDAAAASALSARLSDLATPSAGTDSGEAAWVALELAIDVALEILG